MIVAGWSRVVSVTIVVLIVMTQRLSVRQPFDNSSDFLTNV